MVLNKYNSKGVWFLFFPVITYILLPSSAEADFTGFFFRRDSGLEKKNRPLNLISSPNQGKKANLLRIYSSFIPKRFFFFPAKIPREKKKPLKYPLPSYIFGRSTVLYVITWKNKNHTPLVRGVIFFLIR